MISRHHFVEIKRVKELALSTSRRPIMDRSHRCHAHDQQFAEILIAPVRNPTGFGLTASRMLARHLAKPRRKMAAGSEREHLHSNPA
jgi:hypothetical protein